MMMEADQKARWPIIEIAVEPRSRSDQEKLKPALAELVAADPAIVYYIDDESGQVIVGSKDGLRLRSKIRKLRRDHNLALNIGTLQVAYRETITQAVTEDYTHKKQTGAEGQFARVKIRFEPLTHGEGYEFVDLLPIDSGIKDFAPGVAMGLDLAKNQGCVAGFPMVNLRATLISGTAHQTDSSTLTFNLAARACYRTAMPKAKPILLEPIMAATVTVAESATGEVTELLHQRRGVISGVEATDDWRTIAARVPLANLMDYIEGSGPTGWPGFSIKLDFGGYAPVPQAPRDDSPFTGAMALREGARLA